VGTLGTTCPPYYSLMENLHWCVKLGQKRFTPHQDIRITKDGYVLCPQKLGVVDLNPANIELHAHDLEPGKMFLVGNMKRAAILHFEEIKKKLR